MSVRLDGITGNNLEEIINTTNKNFQKLSEVEFLRGDAGATLSIVNRDINDELAKEIATCIVGDTEKVEYIDNIKEQLKVYNKKWLWFYSSDTPICPAVPLVFLDNDVVNNPENKPDYTCSVVGSIDEDDKVVYSRTAIQPELYFDETALEGTGAWCWEINGVKTGIPASAANAEDRTIPQFFLLKQEKEGSENITYFTVKDENSYGFIPWSEYYTKTGVGKPSSGDYAFIIRTNKNEDGSTVNSLGMSICSSAGAGENIPPTWVPSVFDESYLVSFDKALMKFIFGELYVMEGVTDTVHKGNKKHGLRLKFKDGGDASVYIDTVRGTEDNDNSSLYFIFDPYETADGNSPVSNNLNIVIDSTSGDSNLNLYKGSIEDKNRFITAREILVSGSYSTIYNLYTAGELIPGCFYEIEDYTLVLNPDRTDIKSGDHKFNIILQAISKNKFSEVAKAAPSKDESNTYFSNCDLSKWELKYCIENDIDRFDWAYNRGQGVIYYMKDEWNNECSYDFKNVRYNNEIPGESDSDGIVYLEGRRQADRSSYVYTFCQRYENEIYDLTVSQLRVGPFKSGVVHDNVIKPYFIEYVEGGYNSFVHTKQILNNISIGSFLNDSDGPTTLGSFAIANIAYKGSLVSAATNCTIKSISSNVSIDNIYRSENISYTNNIFENTYNVRISSLNFSHNNISNSKYLYITGFEVCSNNIEYSNHIYFNLLRKETNQSDVIFNEIFFTKLLNNRITTEVKCNSNNISNSEHVVLINSNNNIIEGRSRSYHPDTHYADIYGTFNSSHLGITENEHLFSVSLITSDNNVIKECHKDHKNSMPEIPYSVELTYSSNNFIGKNSTLIYMSYARENSIGEYCYNIILDNASIIFREVGGFNMNAYIECNNIGNYVTDLSLKGFLSSVDGTFLTNIKKFTINRLDSVDEEFSFYNKYYNLTKYSTSSNTQITNSDTIFILDSVLSADGKFYRYTTGTNLATKLLS